MSKSGIIAACLMWWLALGQLAAQDTYANEKHNRLYFITEIGYLNGIGDVTIENTTVSNDGLGARLRFIVGHRINEHFSVGLGLGLDGYHEPSYNTFPVFVNTRGYLKRTKNTPFATVDLGYAVAITDHFEKGVMTNFGIGYKLFTGIFGRKVNFVPSIGINLQEVQRNREIIDNGQFPPQLETITENIFVKSVTINFGVEF